MMEIAEVQQDQNTRGEGCVVSGFNWLYATIFGGCAGGFIAALFYAEYGNQIAAMSASQQNLLHLISGGCGSAFYALWFRGMGIGFGKRNIVIVLFAIILMIGISIIGFLAVAAGPQLVAKFVKEMI